MVTRWGAVTGPSFTLRTIHQVDAVDGPRADSPVARRGDRSRRDCMQFNTDHIRTTHTGSLPRPDDLVELLYAEERGDTDRHDLLLERVRSAVADITAQQRAAGVEILNDGEMGKVGYSTYITARLTGYESRVHVPRPPRSDAADFPRYAAWNAKQ